MDEIVAHCRTQGIATYDLLAPADSYKRAIAHGAVPVRDYAAALTTSGHAAVLAARLTPTVKAVIAAMPGPLRRALFNGRG
jgi:CelD/BcsL family acetyltransferase involved in cellulose biosynthesis